MKARFFCITLVFIGLTACCKIDLRTGILVKYINMDQPSLAVVLQLEKQDVEAIPDTLTYVHLNEMNDYSFFAEFYSSDQYDYVIYVDSTSYSDTITDFSYEIKGRNCQTRVENIEYHHNGKYRTCMELEIP